MSEYFAASEAQTVTSQIESILTSLPLTERLADGAALDSEDGESNSWVEALLRDSSAETIDFGTVKLDTARRVVICNGRYARFAPLDFALLLVLARSRNKMLSYARISRQVWGPTRKISVPRLRVRVFRVRQRLEEERMDGIRILNRGGLGYLMEIGSRAARRAVQRRDLETGSVAIASMKAARPTGRMDERRKIAIAAE